MTSIRERIFWGGLIGLGLGMGVSLSNGMSFPKVIGSAILGLSLGALCAWADG